MSAFGGKADMQFYGCLLLRSLLGVKRTSLVALHMSAFDPKRTSAAGLIQINANPPTWVKFQIRAARRRRFLN
jgi:hypothetical protein